MTKFGVMAMAAALGLVSCGTPEPAQAETPMQRLAAPIKMAPPVYPAYLIPEGVSARVVVRFDVNEKGSVVAARVTDSTDERFNQAALNAVRSWKFPPLKGHRGPEIVSVSKAVQFRSLAFGLKGTGSPPFDRRS